jgi:hypothetical protein
MKISALTVEPLLYYALDLLVRIGDIHIAFCWLIYCNISVLRSFQASAKHIWSRSCWREIRFSNRLIKGFSMLGRNGNLNIGVLALANRNTKFLGHRSMRLAEASKFKRYRPNSSLSNALARDQSRSLKWFGKGLMCNTSSREVLEPAAFGSHEPVSQGLPRLDMERLDLGSRARPNRSSVTGHWSDGFLDMYRG